MPKVPVAPIPVSRIHPQTRTLRLLGRVLLSAVMVFALVATTGAGMGPDSSRAELIMYSLGSALAVIMAIKIVIKLFVYLVQTAVVLAVLGLLYLLTRVVINAVSGS